MTVVSVSYALAPVSADCVGGAEQVLFSLDSALTARGIESVVVAPEGSDVSGELVSFRLPAPPYIDRPKAIAAQRCKAALQAAIRDHAPDLVHMHGLDFGDTLPETGTPVLVSLHLPLAWYPQHWLLDAPRNVCFNCVSTSQQGTAPTGVRIAGVVQNGVDSNALQTRSSKRSFALALGRICPEKNLHVALDAGRMAGRPVLLGGEVHPYPEHEAYFQDQIVPRLDSERRFLGPLDLIRKRRLLTGAACLLLPTLAPETSSLVAMEALACGTPVIAYPSGAIPEIVEDGKTGFLVRSPEEMAGAMRRVSDLDGDACRTAARERFSVGAMVDAYIELYRKLISSRRPAYVA